MIGLHVTTLGCKLNQLDSAELTGALRHATPLVTDPSAARLVVINTCTVTDAADADARQIARRRRRESPEALIVATGCYAERDSDALASMPEIDIVLSRSQRDDAARILLDHLRRRFPDELADGCGERALEETLPDFGGRSRAYLRVQEGCDLRCTYCVIPSVRGPSRSVLPDEAIARCARLLAAGYKEVVLTGVNTGDYGADLARPLSLGSLLKRLSRLEGEYRVRLNSLEPRCVTPDLIETMLEEPRIARHLQVPLQSGSDKVLRAMRRNYRTADYLKILETLRERMPEIGLGADVIVGFPGETDEDFERTLGFIEGSPLNYLHVFSYSRRPGTPAATLSDQVPPEAIRLRSRALRELGRRIERKFHLSQTGRPLEALVLKGRRKDGRLRVLTSNFIEAALAREAEENTFLPVKIAEVGEQETVAVGA